MDYKKEVEELVDWANDAKQNLHLFAHFVARTEFIYQNMPFPSKEVEEEYQKIWVDMEILNAVILCEWEKQDKPQNWNGWEKYKQDIGDVVSQYVDFMTKYFLK